MSEAVWKTLSVALALAAVAFMVFAVYVLGHGQQPQATTGMFGACGLAAFCGIGSFIAWDRDRL